jgi:hypothetical protein
MEILRAAIDIIESPKFYSAKQFQMYLLENNLNNMANVGTNMHDAYTTLFRRGKFTNSYEIFKENLQNFLPHIFRIFVNKRGLL